ncbi:MAG: hypothetical protein JWQ81_2531 [Amycolatopsis sp.]|uniref:3-hydroxyacyl-ACP dehydratase FabZ family protein n=1 Tax=Amycolatopsis sp. TaxID=37632 RepID=UPI00260440EC|nr:hypothetical protein [Amycolatopsis sp.]MCU1681792.1 hypothetical protein [Amycolatopsis sp.]
MDVLTTSSRARPLSALDAVERRSDTEIFATKLVRADDPYLVGHYPGFTIYPGVFIIESVTQAVRSEFDADLTTITSVRFTTSLVPGDTLRVHCEYVRDGEILMVRAECHNGDGVRAAQMRLVFRVAGVPADA